MGVKAARFAIVLLPGALMMWGCTPAVDGEPSSVSAVLPPFVLCGASLPIKVFTPTAEVPEAYRWFSGTWRGAQMHRWEEDGRVLSTQPAQGPTCSGLVVEMVRPDGSVVATYFAGRWPQGGSPYTMRSFDARITGDVLTGTFRNTSNFRFVRQADGSMHLRSGREPDQVAIGTPRIYGVVMTRLETAD